MDVDKAALQRCTLFAGLDDGALDKVVGLFYERQYEVGEPLFACGEKGEAFFFIHRGRVRVSRTAAASLVTVAELAAGDVVGEMALVSSEPRTADGTAVEPTTVWELTDKRFASLAHLEPAIHRSVLRNLTRILCQRLSRATAQVTKVLDTLLEAEMARTSLKERVQQSRQGLLGFLGVLGSGPGDLTRNT